MERVAYHKVTEREDILSCPEYTWRLSHEKSDASISETVHFVPAKLVIWGIEHCVCAEVYNEWNVPVGGRQTLPELGDLKIRISIRKDLAEMAVLYVGSYTQGIDGALTGSEGIYAFHLNEGTGVVSLLQTVKNVTNPSFFGVS